MLLWEMAAYLLLQADCIIWLKRKWLFFIPMTGCPLNTLFWSDLVKQGGDRMCFHCANKAGECLQMLLLFFSAESIFVFLIPQFGCWICLRLHPLNVNTYAQGCVEWRSWGWGLVLVSGYFLDTESEQAKRWYLGLLVINHTLGRQHTNQNW